MLKFSLVDSKYCTLIAVYASTMTSNPGKISSFYDQLDQMLRAIPIADKIVFFGDFNSQVG